MKSRSTASFRVGKRTSPQEKRRHAGFTLLEMMIVAALASIAMLGLLAIWRASQRTLQNAGAATSLARLASSLQIYLKANHADLLVHTANGNAHPITLRQLQAIGLEKSFPEFNSYGQTYAMRVIQPAKGSLHALISTVGGVAMTLDEVIEVSQLAVGRETSAGYISSLVPGAGAPQNCTDDPLNYSRGAFGDWCIELSPFQIRPGAGHVQAALFYTHSPAVDDDALQRNATPGAPQRNRMATAIDMAGNAINNTHSINFSGGRAISDDGAQGIAFTANGSRHLQLHGDGKLELGGGVTIDAPRGGDILHIAGSLISANSAGLGLRSPHGGAINIGSTQSGVPGKLNVLGDVAATGIIAGDHLTTRTVTATGRINADEYLKISGEAEPDAGCQTNGVLAHNKAAGELVQCKRGVWTRLGGMGGIIYVLGDPTTKEQPGSFAQCPINTSVVSAGYMYRYDLFPAGRPPAGKPPTTSTVIGGTNGASVNGAMILGSGPDYIATAACVIN